MEVLAFSFLRIVTSNQYRDFSLALDITYSPSIVARCPDFGIKIKCPAQSRFSGIPRLETLYIYIYFIQIHFLWHVNVF